MTAPDASSVTSASRRSSILADLGLFPQPGAETGAGATSTAVPSLPGGRADVMNLINPRIDRDRDMFGRDSVRMLDRPPGEGRLGSSYI